MHRANGRIINTPPCLLADQPHFINHLETVAHHAYLAAFVVVPSHGNFFQFQARTKSEIEQLHVKAKPIDRRCFNQRLADAHAKSFETALRVPERHSRCYTNDEIENTPTLFTAPRLM